MKQTQMSQRLKEWVKQGLALEKNKGLGQGAVARMLEGPKSNKNRELLGGQINATFMSRVANGMVPQSVPIRIDRRYLAIAKWLEELKITTRDVFFEELVGETSNLDPFPQLPQSTPPSQESTTVVLRPGQTITIQASHPREAVYVVIYGVGVRVEVVAV